MKNYRATKLRIGNTEIGLAVRRADGTEPQRFEFPPVADNLADMIRSAAVAIGPACGGAVRAAGGALGWIVTAVTLTVVAVYLLHPAEGNRLIDAISHGAADAIRTFISLLGRGH